MGGNFSTAFQEPWVRAVGFEVSILEWGSLDECRATQEHTLQRELTLPIFSGNTTMTLSMGREKGVIRKPKMQ